jgi:hypothetical protein
MTAWIVLFVIVDVVVMVLVLRQVLRSRGIGALGVSGVDLGALGRFATALHQEAGRYLQANYSGDPAQLPQALRGLTEIARARATEQGLALDDEVLRKLVEVSATRHKVAKPAEVRAALAA